jgi:hypothetical protein
MLLSERATKYSLSKKVVLTKGNCGVSPGSVPGLVDVHFSLGRLGSFLMCCSVVSC